MLHAVVLPEDGGKRERAKEKKKLTVELDGTLQRDHSGYVALHVAFVSALACFSSGSALACFSSGDHSGYCYSLCACQGTFKALVSALARFSSSSLVSALACFSSDIPFVLVRAN